MLSFLAVFCLDDTLPQMPLLGSFQTVSLEKVFEYADKKTLDAFSRGRSLQLICQWQEVFGRFKTECKDKAVLYLLHILGSDGTYGWIGPLHIRYLPSSIILLRIEDCAQKEIICTRTFPKSARKISLRNNKYFGVPDLAMLPMGLQDLYLGKNCLSGPINLCFLPETMRVLSLADNRIKQHAVLYGNIPKHMNSIFLDNTSIKAVYAISDTPANTRYLFHGMKPSQIHCSIR